MRIERQPPLRPVLVPYYEWFDCVFCFKDEDLKENIERAVFVLRGTKAEEPTEESVLAWLGCEIALIEYIEEMISEAKDREHRTGTDEFLDRYSQEVKQRYFQLEAKESIRPDFMDDESVLEAHQSFLIRRDKYHYGEFFEGVPDDITMTVTSE